MVIVICNWDLIRGIQINDGNRNLRNKLNEIGNEWDRNID